MSGQADSDEQSERTELEREVEQGIASITCDLKSTGDEDPVVQILTTALNGWNRDRDVHCLKAKLEAALVLLAHTL